MLREVTFALGWTGARIAERRSLSLQAPHKEQWQGGVRDDLRAWEKMARVLMERGEEEEDDTMLNALCRTQERRSAFSESVS